MVEWLWCLLIDQFVFNFVQFFVKLEQLYLKKIQFLKNEYRDITTEIMLQQIQHLKFRPNGRCPSSQPRTESKLPKCAPTSQRYYYLCLFEQKYDEEYLLFLVDFLFICI